MTYVVMKIQHSRILTHLMKFDISHNLLHGDQKETVFEKFTKKKGKFVKNRI